MSQKGPKRAKRIPKWAKRDPEWANRCPNWVKRDSAQAKRGPANGQIRVSHRFKRKGWVSELRGTQQSGA